MEHLEVLIVEDNPADLEILKRYLGDIESRVFEFRHEKTLQGAMDAVNKHVPDLLLLDHVLPRRNGVEFMSEFQNRELYLPAILVTGEGDETLLSHSLRQGADDYIRKSDLSPSLLEHSIDYVLDVSKKRFKRELKVLELEMMGDNRLDLLTGLHNREALINRLTSELKNSTSEGKCSPYLIFIDIDGFERVNDRKGFLAGDKLLKAIGTTLTSMIGEHDFLARYGSDEFCIIHTPSHQSETPDLVEAVNKKLDELLQQWVGEQNLNFSISSSLGLTQCDPNRGDADKHIEDAKKAMRHSKKTANRSVVSNREVVSSALKQFPQV